MKEVGTKTYSPKPADIERKWILIDASGRTLGRLASDIARLLQGKHKTIFARHMDTGDYVIVINASKMNFTGNKLEDKKYYRHSGYPGGLKERTLGQMMQSKPEEVLRKAVKGMLPKNRLGRQMIKKLKIYAGLTHPHQAQKPEKL